MSHGKDPLYDDVLKFLKQCNSSEHIVTIKHAADEPKVVTVAVHLISLERLGIWPARVIHAALQRIKA